MNYGFMVFFSDSSGAKYRYYAQYARSKDEAIQIFRIDQLLNNQKKLKIEIIEPATKFEWEHFDWHGDCFNPPNAKHGVPKRQIKRKSRANK